MVQETCRCMPGGSGRIVFRDEPLANVAEDFNRLNRTRLLIDDTAAGAMRLTGNLRGDDVASLRAFLAEQRTLRVSASASADVIRVGSRAAGRALATSPVPDTAISTVTPMANAACNGERSHTAADDALRAARSARAPITPRRSDRAGVDRSEQPPPALAHHTCHRKFIENRCPIVAVDPRSPGTTQHCALRGGAAPAPSAPKKD